MTRIGCRCSAHVTLALLGYELEFQKDRERLDSPARVAAVALVNSGSLLHVTTTYNDMPNDLDRQHTPKENYPMRTHNFHALPLRRRMFQAIVWFMVLTLLYLPVPGVFAADQPTVHLGANQIFLPTVSGSNIKGADDQTDLEATTATATLDPRPAVGPFLATHIWPIEGANATMLSSTFGPRQQASESYRFDWHRGIDIPTPCHTPVKAVADGKIRLAGDVSGFSDTMVEITHTKPISVSAYYYSVYLHLESVATKVNGQPWASGDSVTQGQVIGYSGDSDIGHTHHCQDGTPLGGFDHLHFEIRDGGVRQKHAINPLLVLQPDDHTAPTIQVTNIDASNPLQPIVDVHVQIAHTELDLQRVEVVTYDRASGSLVELGRTVFDMHDRDYAYTPYNGSSDLTILDTAPAYDGVYDGDYGNGPVANAPLGVAVNPAPMNASTDSYVMDLSFTDLAGVAAAGNLVVKATATDVYGNRATAVPFAGSTWEVKAKNKPTGPGPNYFSDNSDDVWVDAQGSLHLRIDQHDGHWVSTEVFNPNPLGYGTYSFTVRTPAEGLDPQAVLGLFVYESDTQEIDMELSQWGDPTAQNAQYVVQPYDREGHLQRFDLAADAITTTHRFVWQPGMVDFTSWEGDGSGTPVTSWHHASADVPGPDSALAHMNLWLFRGEPPQRGQSMEVVVSNFTFSPLCSSLTGSGVQLFSDADCGGSTRSFTAAGNIDLNGFDDVTSSIYIGPGWSAWVFERSNQFGPSYCVSQTQAALSNPHYEGFALTLNDSISSLIVYDNSSCTPALEVVEPLTLSTSQGYVGQQVTAHYALKNTGSFPITIYGLGVFAGTADCDALNVCSLLGAFPRVSNTTLQPGDTYTYTQSRSFGSTDNLNESILLYWYYKGATHTLGTPVALNIAPGLETPSPITATATIIAVSQPVTVTAVVVNDSPQPITFNGIGFLYCLKDPVTGADVSCQYPSVENRPLVTLQPGQTYTYSQPMSFSEAGRYRVTALYGDQGTNGWSYVRSVGPVNGGTNVYISVNTMTDSGSNLPCSSLTGSDVQLFSDADCGGAARSFTAAGNVDLSGFDNTTSSIYIGPGWSARSSSSPTSSALPTVYHKRKLRSATHIMRGLP